MNVSGVSPQSPAAVELAKFFAITNECPGPIEMFSPYIDQFWHELYEDREAYFAFSMNACGRVLRHVRSEGHGEISWISLYEAKFGSLSELWFADETGSVDNAALNKYCSTGRVSASWDCSPQQPDDDGDGGLSD